MLKALKTIRSGLSRPWRKQERLLDRTLFLQGVTACQAIRSKGPLRHLSEAEIRVYSQWGEDGILEWLIQHLPVSSHRFVEFGVEDYAESNTRFLLMHRNWKGLIMDGSSENMKKVQADEIYWRHDLTAVPAFIDRDNINSLLREHNFSGRVGLLSVDIDGNDYWVWEAIDGVDADIVVAEYNAVFGDIYPLTVPYRRDFQRTAAHHSNLYYGASIGALCLLAQRKGYKLVGSNRAGTNAFFVRLDLFPSLEGALKSKRALPSRVRESRGPDGKLSFRAGTERLREIESLPVVLVATGKTTLLKTIGPLYSSEWLGDMSNGTQGPMTY